MEFVKENILDLLGADSRKYHSAILTSFSFDFSFFETRVMRSLKGAGIRNILVLVDEQSLAELMEKPSGMEFRRNVGYGIYPIDAPGVFHPKILFCSGTKEGFLAIGSGNLTAAGHGSNDELWSVFHFKGIDSINAPIFSQVWSYLLSITAPLSGNAEDKVFRMSSHSEWIEKLPKSNLTDFVSLGRDEITILPVKEGDNRMDLVYGLIDPTQVREIKIVSPYFEKDGLFLLNLRKNYPDAIIRVVVDTNFGLLPYELGSNSIEFHDWQLSYSGKNDDISRLHGKLFVFSLENGSELIISGSSNATTAAFGIPEKKAKNKELNVVVRRENSDIFREIGLTLTKDSLIDLSHYKDKQAPDVFDRPPLFEGLIKLKFAEILGSEISLVSTGNVKEMVSLKVFDRDRKVLGTLPPLAFQHKITVKLKKTEELPFFACWENEEGKRISNYVLIQDTAIHLKTNPDPSTERLESMFDDIEKGNFGQVADLLSLVSFVNEEDGSPQVTFGSGTTNAGRTETKKEYEVAPTYEEFAKLSEAHLLKQKGLLLSPNVRIAEFLSIVQKRQMPILEEGALGAESQITNTDTSDGGETDPLSAQPPKQIRLGINELRKEKDAVLSYLQNYHRHLLQRTSIYLNTPYLRDFKPSVVNLQDYSNLLIAMQLVKNYAAKKFEYVENDEEKSEVFLSLLGDKPFNNQKSFFLEMVPHFLFLAEQGTRSYEYESTQIKMLSFLKDSFFNIVFLACNTSWVDHERPWVKLIVLNAAHIAGKNTKQPVADLLRELDLWFHKAIENDIYKSFRLVDEYKDLVMGVLRPATASLEGLIDGQKTIVSTDTLRPGNLIYNSKLGICEVKKIKDGICPDQKELLLMKPGFNWDENEKAWIFRQEFRKNVLLEI